MENFYFKFDPILNAKATTLLERFHWRTQPHSTDRFCVELTTQGLSLNQLGARTKPLIVDWAQGLSEAQFRRRFTKKDPWLKALGSPTEYETVIDGTMGFGHDAFIMALLGFQVEAFERSSVIFALAQDAFERLPSSFSDIAERLQLNHQDFRENQINYKPDIIYLDPMFPERSKSALVKKEMRWLHELVGGSEDNESLFQQAMACSPRKIVVKRPARGEPLSDSQHHQFKGQSTRYDVYLVK